MGPFKLLAISPKLPATKCNPSMIALSCLPIKPTHLIKKLALSNYSLPYHSIPLNTEYTILCWYYTNIPYCSHINTTIPYINTIVKFYQYIILYWMVNLVPNSFIWLHCQFLCKAYDIWSCENLFMFLVMKFDSLKDFID